MFVDLVSRLCLPGAVMLLVGACTGGSDPQVDAAPPATALRLGFAVKQLRFSWDASIEADRYRLFENADGASGFEQIGAELGAGTTSAAVDKAVHRHDWANARYLLEACNQRGCTASAEVTSREGMLPSIGYLKPALTAGGERFGHALAISRDGNTLAVGARDEQSASAGIDSTPDLVGDRNGAVFVFVRGEDGWSQQAYLKAANSGVEDRFGFDVALSADGNTLAVGADREDGAGMQVGATPDDAGNDNGAVYVFVRNDGVWRQQAYIKASNSSPRDRFGVSVALSEDGDTLAVGADREDGSGTGVGGTSDDLGDDNGAVYVFVRTADAWSEQAYVKPSNGGPDDRFGRDVALAADGDTLAAGAPNEDSTSTGIDSAGNDDGDDNGAVYVFARVASTWRQQAYVKGGLSPDEDGFGGAVALNASGDTLAVGAEFEDSDQGGIDGVANQAGEDNGAVFVFQRVGDAWQQQAYVKPADNGNGDEFGAALALSASGDDLLVGAWLEDGAGTGIDGVVDDQAESAGAAFLFERVSGVWSERHYVKASNSGAGDGFANALAMSGDGFTIAIGAAGEASLALGIGGDQADDRRFGTGAVYLY